MPFWWQGGTGDGSLYTSVSSSTATTSSSLWTGTGCWIDAYTTTTCAATTSGAHTHFYRSYVDETQQAYGHGGLVNAYADQYRTALSQQAAMQGLANRGLLADDYARAMMQQQAAQQQAVMHEEYLRGMQPRAPLPAEPRRPRDAAEQRAEQLLLEHLTPVQRETYRSHGWFIVQGGRSQKSYRIRSGSMAGNIDALDDNRRLCAHLAPSMIPLGDHLLAQMLWLLHDERGFLAVANPHPPNQIDREFMRQQIEAAERAIA